MAFQVSNFMPMLNKLNSKGWILHNYIYTPSIFAYLRMLIILDCTSFLIVTWQFAMAFYNFPCVKRFDNLRILIVMLFFELEL